MNRIPNRWVPLAAGVVAAFLGLVGVVALWNGFPLRWSPDSVHYFAIAESISSGGGFTGIDGGPTVVWPPGYSLVLSLGAIVPGGTNAVARAANILAYVAVVVVSSVILHRVVRNSVIRWVGIAAVVVSPALALVFVHVWSDLLFTALVMGGFALVLLSLDREDRRLLAVAGVVVGLTVVVRYLGVSAGLAGVIAVFLAGGGTWRRRLGDVAVFGLGAFGIPGLLFAWNVVRTGTLTGERLAACTSIRAVVSRVFDAIGRWFAFDAGPWLGFGVVAVVLGAAVLAWLVTTDHGVKNALTIFVLFVMFYLGMFVMGSVSANIDPPDFRLLLPVYVPIVILAIALSDVFVGRWRAGSGAGRWLTAAWAVGAITVLVIGPVLLSKETAAAWATGIRYDVRRQAAESAILAEDLSGGGHVVSNRPHFVYLEWGGPVQRSPFLHSCASDRPHSHVLDEASLEELVSGHGSVTLVWFDTGDGTLPEFDRIVSQRLVEADDGEVVRLTGIAGPDS